MCIELAMSATLLKRCVIFCVTMCVHTNNLCITGLCEPASVHKSVVKVPDRPALIFAIAVALAIAEVELWPKRWPFRPLQKNLIFAIELLISLTINNLMLRLFWLPFVHSVLKLINCYFSSALLHLKEMFLGRSKSGFTSWLAKAACSPAGVEVTATVLAGFILTTVLLRLYGQRLKAIYKCLKKCAATGATSERVLRLRNLPSTCGKTSDDPGHGDVAGDDADGDGVPPWVRLPLLCRSLHPPPISRQESRQSCTASDRSRR